MRTKTVSSSYWFLINSNVSALDTSTIGLQHLRNFTDGLQRIFLSQNILNFIKILDTDDENIPKQDLISKIEADVEIETGSKRNMVHAHVIIKIHHRTTIKFITNRISRFYARKYNQVVYTEPPKIIADHSIFFTQYQEKTRPKPGKLVIKNTIIPEDGTPMDFFYRYT